MRPLTCHIPSHIYGRTHSVPSTLLAVEAWVAPAKMIIEPVLDLGGVAFLIRIILSWYPQVSPSMCVCVPAVDRSIHDGPTERLALHPSHPLDTNAPHHADTTHRSA
jgi:hypothetical protein